MCLAVHVVPTRATRTRTGLLVAATASGTGTGASGGGCAVRGPGCRLQPGCSCNRRGAPTCDLQPAVAVVQVQVSSWDRWLCVCAVVRRPAVLLYIASAGH